MSVSALVPAAAAPAVAASTHAASQLLLLRRAPAVPATLPR